MRDLFSRRIAAAALSVVAVLLAPAGAAAAVAGYVTDVIPASDGGARVATAVVIPRQGRWGVNEYRLGPGGVELSSRALILATSRQTSAYAALAGDGAVGEYTVPGKHRSVVRGAVWGPISALGRARTISDKRHGASGFGAFGGPNGAGAVVFRQGQGHHVWQDMIAVRRAGSPVFGEAVALGPVRRSRFASDVPADTDVAFAPDGSGVVVQAPTGQAGPITARRISVSGVVGPLITVVRGEWNLGSATVVIGPAGTAVMAFRAMNDSSAPGDDVLGYHLLVSTLPVGASTSTPVQRLGAGGRPSDDAPDFALAVGDGDQTMLASGEAQLDRLNVFEGSATALAKTGSVSAFDHSGANVVATADGGATVVWVGTPNAVMKGTAVMAAHRPAGGVWSSPSPITPVVSTPELGPYVGAVTASAGSGSTVYTASAPGPRARATTQVFHGP